MRPLLVGGIVLIALGALAFSIHSITYFTTEHQIGPLGFFQWDVSQPNTIWFSPVAGIAAIGLGVILILMANARRAT